MQETKVSHSQEVKRKNNTWFLSGNDKEIFTHHGVGIVIRNELRGRIVDKEAGRDRMMRKGLQALRQVDIVSVCAPVAKAQYASEQQMEVDKDLFYEMLKKWSK